jgi:hypothetical protein
LEIKVGVIDLVRLNGGQGATQVGFIQAKGLKQQGFGRGQTF